MSTLLIGLILISFSAPLALLSRKKIEELLPISIMGIIFVLYLCGLFGNLSIGFHLILLLSIISLGLFLFLFHRDRKSWTSLLITPGLMAFCLLLFIVYWGHQDRVFSEWDEFSHWGLVIKNMFFLDKLGNAPEATTSFRGYPPAASLFAYFGIKLSGCYNESDAFRSANLFLFILILPIFKRATWKRPVHIFVLFLFLLLLPPLFNETALTTIYVDTLLGFMFAFVLYEYFTANNLVLELPFICLPLFSLPLVKSSGTGLALIAFIIIFLDVFFIQNHLSKKLRAFLTVLPLISALAGKFSWDIYLKLTDTQEAWNTSKLTLPNIISLLLGNAEPYQYNTIHNFIQAFCKDPQYDFGHVFHFNALWWALLFAALSFLLILCLNSKLRRRYLLCLSSVEIGFCIYAFSLLLLYLFTFSAYESERLASFVRYLSTFLTGMFAFLIYLFIEFTISKTTFGRNTCYLLLVLILSFSHYPNVLSITIDKEDSISASKEIRKQHEISPSILEKLDADTNRVYLISQGDNGFNVVILRYEFTPVYASSPAYSLGPPYYDGDVWTKDYTIEELSEALEDYTHMYIYEADNQFKALYSSLFEDPSSIQNKTLYRVNHLGNHITLTIE